MTYLLIGLLTTLIIQLWFKKEDWADVYENFRKGREEVSGKPCSYSNNTIFLITHTISILLWPLVVLTALFSFFKK